MNYVNSDVPTILFVFVVGWITGSQPLTAPQLDWFTARETIGTRVGAAECTIAGSPFQLRQVLVADPSTLPPLTP